jgi:hypothetical protein
MSGLRICVVGGGLAGSLLAWRLAGNVARVDLVAGDERADATAASGGVVRGFETDPRLAEAAASSLLELRASRTLRRWAHYREIGSAYLHSPRASTTQTGTETEDLVRALEAQLPGSAEVLSCRELAAAGWAGLPTDCVGVTERHAGTISPEALRRSILGDLAGGGSVRLLPGTVHAVEATAAGVRIRGAVDVGEHDVSKHGVGEHGVGGHGVGGHDVSEYDLVVVAAGRWTAPLLERSALPAAGLRTKCVQYALHPVAGPRPPAFVDETSGLYGRPVGRRSMLLGVPVDVWDVDPDAPLDVRQARSDAAARAARRLPRMRLLDGPVVRVVSADSYADPPMLALRPVPGSSGQVLTFAGGSGGSAKSALAASHTAAALLSSGRLVAA